MFGIIPLPQQTRNHLGLLNFHLIFAKKHDIRNEYLAWQQNTRVAVLPIHMKAERWAFLISEAHGLFSDLASQIGWPWLRYGQGTLKEKKNSTKLVHCCC